MHFSRIPNLESANDCSWNLFFYLDSLFNNLRFCLPIPPSLLLTLLQLEAVVRWCSVKKMFQQISQISQENTSSKDAFSMKLQIYSVTLSKKRFRHRCFFCEFWEISHKTFFKEPFGRLLLQKHSFCLLSRHDLVPFQKRCDTYFSADYFLGLICRLGTRASPIF